MSAVIPLLVLLAQLLQFIVPWQYKLLCRYQNYPQKLHLFGSATLVAAEKTGQISSREPEHLFAGFSCSSSYFSLFCIA